MEISKFYNPKEVEEKLMEFWEKNKIYKFNPDSKKKIYSIDTPPPTVSGRMHMGHAFGNSQQDFIARYKRMRGFNVLQPFGTDDNGLPTQTLIENIKNVRAKEMDRREFRKLCLDTLEKELKPRYTKDWKRLGISCDFEANYSTIDKHCQKISQWSFLDLYKKGRQYRAEAAAMFCPKCQTAIAQVECEDKEVSSSFNDIVFKVNGEKLIISTTRPELLPACVAVFYHPNDKRYKHLNGKKAKVPLFNFEVPILEDERADPEKGTGIVMCCTFGDSTDAEWQKAHKLPVKEAINKEGNMTSLAKDYEGMEIKEARKKIIEDLKKNNLLVKQEPIVHTINVHERCGTPVEFIFSKQWFVKYLDLKEDMVKWGNGLNWFPPYMKHRYENWVKGLQWDWCISRQIYFGIPFPVWYCGECDEIILAREKDLPVDPIEDKPPVNKCPKCGGKDIKGEKDIINTWATSSLTPTIVKELFKGKPVYRKLNNNPLDLRPQGHDIISFWLFNTVVKSKLHFNMLPWNDCFINGWILDPRGKKMSKSKGNIIEPQEMIDKYSADALRFMSAASKLGEDLPFQEKEMVSGQKLINKLWNSFRFSLMHLEDFKFNRPKNLELMDQWVLIKLNKLIRNCTKYFEDYNFSKSKTETENFFWHVFCDNYLEIIKDRLYNPDKRGKDSRESAQYTLYTCLLNILKLFSPIIPFITEEIYQNYFIKKEKEKSIHLCKWPEEDKKINNKKIENLGDKFIETISFVRKKKAEENKSLKTPVKLLYCDKKLNDVLEELKAVTKAKEIKFGSLKIEF